MDQLIKSVQEALAAKGFDPGPIDGVSGRKTIAAIEAYQIAEKLPIKYPGTLGPITLGALFPGNVDVTTKPLSAAVSRPWLDLAIQKKGLNESKDYATLSKFLKSDGDTVGDPRKNPWCFAGETEILTENGWQRLDDLSAQRVYQVDANGRASLAAYVPIRKEYDGDAYLIDSPAVRVVCDVGHRWWGSWGYRGRARQKMAAAFGVLGRLNYDGLTIDGVIAAASGVAVSDDELTMIAAFMSDGFMHAGKVEFSVSRRRKVIALTALGPSHTYTQARPYGAITKAPLTVLTFDVPACFEKAFAGYKLLSRAFINELSATQCDVFLRAYAGFDGSVREDGRITLYTSDSAIRDDLITIAALAGYRPSVERGGRSEMTKKDSWRVGFMPKAQVRRIMPEDVTRIPYSGEMFCVSVPEGRIIIRGENMVPCVTGNCGDFVETCIALTLPHEPLPTNPYLARNWLKFGVECEPQLGAVLIFWRGQRNGISGHVTFDVGKDKGKLYCLGGNQTDGIKNSPIDEGRLLGARWPATMPLPATVFQPTMTGGRLSLNEA